MKKCRNCKKDFEAKISNQYGKQKYCSKSCKSKYETEHRNKEYKKYQSLWWKRNKDKTKLYHLKYKDKIKEYERKFRKTPRYKQLRKKWEKNNGYKISAMQKANRKIKIPKNQICEVCETNIAIHKHHPNYSKPLEVKFVCASCHYKLDEKRRNRELK